MRRIIRTLAVIACMVFILSAFSNVIALDHHVSRGDFFLAMAKYLEIKGCELEEAVFPDYENNLPLINEQIEKRWLRGRDTGLLALDEELTLSDMNYYLDRVEWPVKMEKLTEYAPVYISVPQPDPHYASPDDCPEHQFRLNESGSYECVFCGYSDPVGAKNIPIVTHGYDGTPAGLSGAAIQVDFSGGLLDLPNAAIVPDSTYPYYVYTIAYNAVIFVDGNRVGYSEFFQNYKDCILTGRYYSSDDTNYYINGIIDGLVIDSYSASAM